MSEKQQRFVGEYLKSLNATDAARKAGYKNPNQASTKLMANPQIATAIAHVTKGMTRRLEFSAEDVLQRLWYGLNFNPCEWFYPSENGWACEDPSKLPPEVGRMVKAIRVRRFESDAGVDTSYEVVLNPHGTELLDMAMKHKGLFPKEMIQPQIQVNLAAVIPNLLKEVEAGRNVIDGEVVQQRAIEE